MGVRVAVPIRYALMPKKIKARTAREAATKTMPGRL